jgi:hypothetical protein
MAVDNTEEYYIKRKQHLDNKKNFIRPRFSRRLNYGLIFI